MVSATFESTPLLQITSERRRHRCECPSCDAPSSEAFAVRYSHPDWPMVQCAHCDLVYLEYVPSYSELYHAIAWTQQHKREEDRRFKQSPILARIGLWTRWRLGLFGDATPAGGLTAWAKPGPVLDIGCATGKAFAELPSAYIPNGIEIDAAAAEKARAIFEPRGGRLINADAVSGLKQFPERFFSGVSLWSYLEHEARPREALEGVRRVLRQDGIVLVKVPNFNCWNRWILGAKWPGFRHPDHVQYFTPATLAWLARATGFDIRFRLYGRIPLNDNMYAVLTVR